QLGDELWREESGARELQPPTGLASDRDDFTGGVGVPSGGEIADGVLREVLYRNDLLAGYEIELAVRLEGRRGVGGSRSCRRRRGRTRGGRRTRRGRRRRALGVGVLLGVPIGRAHVLTAVTQRDSL